MQVHQTADQIQSSGLPLPKLQKTSRKLNVNVLINKEKHNCQVDEKQSFIFKRV